MVPEDKTSVSRNVKGKRSFTNSLRFFPDHIRGGAALGDFEGVTNSRSYCEKFSTEQHNLLKGKNVQFLSPWKKIISNMPFSAKNHCLEHVNRWWETVSMCYRLEACGQVQPSSRAFHPISRVVLRNYRKRGSKVVPKQTAPGDYSGGCAPRQALMGYWRILQHCLTISITARERNFVGVKSLVSLLNISRPLCSLTPSRFQFIPQFKLY